jgi:hypothetical protein
MATIFRPPVRNPNGPRVTTVPNPKEAAEFGPRSTQVRLMSHFRHHGGYPVTVYIKNGIATEVDAVRPDVAAVQDYVFLGGHDHLITSFELMQSLAAAGYSDCLFSNSFYPDLDVYPDLDLFPGSL